MPERLDSSLTKLLGLIKSPHGYPSRMQRYRQQELRLRLGLQTPGGLLKTLSDRIREASANFQLTVEFVLADELPDLFHVMKQLLHAV